MEIQTAIPILAALAQETRLAAFRLLAQAGLDGLAAGDIAARLGVPAPTLSFHLKELTHAGLVTAQRDGRTIRYAIRLDAMRELLAFLSEDCCQGHPELCLPAVPLMER